MTDALGLTFGALADPTRRQMLESLLHEETTTVPALTAALPITRQAVAKHLGVLTDAGLVERAPAAGRQVRYRLTEGGLGPAALWMADAETRWEGRLDRLKRSVEGR